MEGHLDLEATVRTEERGRSPPRLELRPLVVSLAADAKSSLFALEGLDSIRADGSARPSYHVVRDHNPSLLGRHPPNREPGSHQLRRSSVDRVLERRSGASSTGLEVVDVDAGDHGVEAAVGPPFDSRLLERDGRDGFVDRVAGL